MDKIWKSAASVALSLTLVLLSPGLDCYAASVAMTSAVTQTGAPVSGGMGSGALRPVPGTLGALRLSPASLSGAFATIPSAPVVAAAAVPAPAGIPQAWGPLAPRAPEAAAQEQAQPALPALETAVRRLSSGRDPAARTEALDSLFSGGRARSDSTETPDLVAAVPGPARARLAAPRPAAAERHIYILPQPMEVTAHLGLGSKIGHVVFEFACKFVTHGSLPIYLATGKIWGPLALAAVAMLASGWAWIPAQCFADLKLRNTAKLWWHGRKLSRQLSQVPGIQSFAVLRTTAGTRFKGIFADTQKNQGRVFLETSRLLPEGQALPGLERLGAPSLVRDPERAAFQLDLGTGEKSLSAAVPLRDFLRGAPLPAALAEAWRKELGTPSIWAPVTAWAASLWTEARDILRGQLKLWSSAKLDAPKHGPQVSVAMVEADGAVRPLGELTRGRGVRRLLRGQKSLPIAVTEFSGPASAPREQTEVRYARSGIALAQWLVGQGRPIEAMETLSRTERRFQDSGIGKTDQRWSILLPMTRLRLALKRRAAAVYFGRSTEAEHLGIPLDGPGIAAWLARRSQDPRHTAGRVNPGSLARQSWSDCVVRALWNHPSLAGLHERWGTYEEFLSWAERTLHRPVRQEGLRDYQERSLLRALGWERGYDADPGSEEELVARIRQSQGLFGSLDFKMTLWQALVQTRSRDRSFSHAVVVEAAVRDQGRWWFVVSDSNYAEPRVFTYGELLMLGLKVSAIRPIAGRPARADTR